MNTLYCDCFSGISGDMFLAACIDAGFPIELLESQLNQLKLAEFHGVEAKKVKKGAIGATQVEFMIHEHDHDLDHKHEHAHENGHNQHDSDGFSQHDHSHSSRNFVEICKMINSSKLSDRIKQVSGRIFEKLAIAEGKVHGTTPQEVHFHEVGAADSILDIVGAAIALEYFDIQKFYCSTIPLGSGTVMTQHGLLPLPAPATMELIKESKIPVTPSTAKKELVTPTGAAILASLATFKQPDMTIERIGIGAGKLDFDWPNILRIFVGSDESGVDSHVEIEANIDDMNPQIFGYAMAKLFSAGALDVYFTPIYMKKNRPATKISVIALKKHELELSNILLRETSTLGVRVQSIWRHEMKREIRTIETQYGSISVKLKIDENKILQVTPEFDECSLIAEKTGKPVKEILQEVIAQSEILFHSS